MNRKQRIAELEHDLTTCRDGLAQARDEIREGRSQRERAELREERIARQSADKVRHYEAVIARIETADLIAQAFRQAVLDGVLFMNAALNVDAGCSTELTLRASCPGTTGEALFRGIAGPKSAVTP